MNEEKIISDAVKTALKPINKKEHKTVDDSIAIGAKANNEAILNQKITELKKDIEYIEKRLTNCIAANEASRDYIDDFQKKLDFTVGNVVNMVNSNKNAMDVIFQHLRWHRIVIILMPAIYSIARWVAHVLWR